MREKIRDILIENVKTVNGEVWEPSAAGPDLPKPHLILRESSQDPGEPYADYTAFYEVWPYVKRTTFKNVDTLSKEVISALNRKKFDVNGIPHYIEYSSSSEDVVDEEWDALTRGLRFQVFSLAWLVHSAVDPDPVEAMRTWSETRFPALQTDPTTWSPDDEKPALYWRQGAISGVETTNWGAWITARLHGHVISPERSVRRRYVEEITRRLAIDKVTRMADKSKMRFITVAADDGYNPFNQGQIQLSVTFGVLREKMPKMKLKHVYFDSERGGEVHV